jgi:hypothetical protein
MILPSDRWVPTRQLPSLKSSRPINQPAASHPRNSRVEPACSSLNHLGAGRKSISRPLIQGDQNTARMAPFHFLPPSSCWKRDHHLCAAPARMRQSSRTFPSFHACMGAAVLNVPRSELEVNQLGQGLGVEGLFSVNHVACLLLAVSVHSCYYGCRLCSCCRDEIALPNTDHGYASTQAWAAHGHTITSIPSHSK